MKSKFIIFVLIIFCICFTPTYAQVHFEGNLNSTLYAWEMTEDERQMDFYQGVYLRVFPVEYSNLEFRTNFRFARRGDPAEWNEKIYNTFLRWKSNDRNTELKFGRQFVYHGVLNGTVDGMLASTNLTDCLSLKVLAGVPAVADRKFDVTNWLDGNVFGGLATYRLANNFKADLSYYQRTRNEKSIYELMGVKISGKIINSIYFTGKIDYNVKDSDYQNMRYRLTYLNSEWSVFGEFNSQKPRAYEGSFFKIFEIEAHNQVRAGVSYQLGEYQFGLRNIFTIYEDDNSNQVQLSIANRWGLVGFIYQNGYAGDNSGFFGEVRYDLLKNVTVSAYSSYYNYQRHTTEIGEEALAFSGKIEYRPIKDLRFQVEAQESQNSYYDNELRGLFRLTYMFNHTL